MIISHADCSEGAGGGKSGTCSISAASARTTMRLDFPRRCPADETFEESRIGEPEGILRWHNSRKHITSSLSVRRSGELPENTEVWKLSQHGTFFGSKESYLRSFSLAHVLLLRRKISTCSILQACRSSCPSPFLYLRSSDALFRPILL